MNIQHLFNFKTDLSGINTPDKLNNPFGLEIPEIARIATSEFQEFIVSESKKWKSDFSTLKGKMFGVLVVQKKDKSIGYLGTVSGKLPENSTCSKFVPSVFDDSTDDFFISKGMKELTEIGIKISESDDQSEIIELTESRKLKSFGLQQRLFESYHFLNLLGEKNSVLQIFKNSTHSNPPAAAGECAAPKLLQYAFTHQLKPIAIAEFWWGTPSKNKEREHKAFYPSCKNKCRPILEYMLDNRNLFIEAS